ncbi:CusA/CzcA family heavy metal efflux RND transporter [Apibacter muscae]|uniref:CusA/CzcA family heavy metal efflux RND transporter n=1 Tax=Apibacter muscae TaxID=2509004 RepID=A0A563DGQ9_9FLAO|nr:CusA/CzcA family heavy metal efflux RND transporter [Apibacter muscae]TWP29043.1 CusA/CzcA family heavy metal efflux RND transporter [Apibacter muscae]
MFKKIIEFSINNKLLIIVGTLALLIGGVYSVKDIAIDATPDITNNQVQVVTTSPTLAPQEVEKLITFPLESQLRNIPGTTEVRSISRFGLSIITVVFKENIPTLQARQLVKEQVDIAKSEIPDGLGDPELMPITTGLGEIYQYVLKVKPGYENQYNTEKLRTIQDWIIKRQLNGVEGIIEISSFGGNIREYEISIDPVALQSYNLTLEEVHTALENNNQNSGSGYIQQKHNLFYIRTEGMIKNFQDIENIVISLNNKVPIKISDVAQVKIGSAQRFGAMTMDGQGEVVGGITLMLKGADSYKTVQNVKQRVTEIEKNLPEGLDIYEYLDRANLIDKTISTVTKNLIEGGLIVIFVLILLLGNLRAGLIVASVIPLSLLFALAMMDLFGVSANLLSLGAMDFGIVVDGAIIIIESVIHVLYTSYLGKKLTQKEMDGVVTKAAGDIYKSASFGIMIIILVFVPIMTLTGIEGKMFRPMALAVSFAILGAFILSLTYVPVMTTMFINKNIKQKITFADKIMNFLKKLYLPVLQKVLKIPYTIVSLVVAIWLMFVFVFMKMGSEFVPTLQEGDIAMQMSIQPGSSLDESIATTTKAEKILKENFPEVLHVVSKIGTAEVPTDPMGIEDADIMIILKEKKDWISATTQEELVNKMKEKLSVILGASFEFSQPIQLRFNELMTGAKADVVIKIFGEDTEELKKIADKAAESIHDIKGAADVKVEQTEGLKQMNISYNREKIAQYGLNINSLNQIIRSTIAGQSAGVVLEGEKRFDIVLRLNENYRKDLNLNQIYVKSATGILIPLSEVASMNYESGPMMISREQAQRKINIGVNVRGVDVATLVKNIQTKLDKDIKLPPGYRIQYGGAFENLQQASARLSIVIPIALITIIFLLYVAFKSLKDALIIFTAVPLASIGGIIALWARGLPFSISAGVGFIALFGVAVLNGIVLVGELNDLKKSGKFNSLKDLIIQGSLTRLRPVFMTAMVATLGFYPMAISSSNGSEVQHPLATVVIGGLVTSTLLTLLIVPAIYYIVENKSFKKLLNKTNTTLGVFILGGIISIQGQTRVALPELLQRVSTENMELQGDRMQIEKEQLEKKYAYTVQNTSITAGYGEYNDRKGDYQVELEQNLGNLFSYRSMQNLSDSKINWLNSLFLLKKHTLELQVEQTYNQWLYSIEKRNLLLKMDSLYQSGLKRAEFRYQQGETDYMEKQFFKVELDQIIRRITSNEQEYLNVENQLYNLCKIDLNNKIIPIESFSRLENDYISSTPLPLFTQEFDQAMQFNNQTVMLGKSQRLPELSVGTIMHSIDQRSAYFSGVVGINIPLFNNSYKKLKEQSYIENQFIENNKEQKVRSLELRIKQLKEQEDLFNKEIASLGENHLNELIKMRKVALTKYKYGEIDYLQYCSLLKASVEAHLTYLDLIHDYNQVLIEIKYLTQQN